MNAAVKAYQNVARKELRDQLITEHLDSVRHVLGRLTARLPGFIDEENLEAAGFLGLVEAATNFDPARGVEFRTFAYHRIRGAILDELRRNCPLPQHILQQWSLIQASIAKLGELATSQSIAAACGITEEEVTRCVAAVRLAQPESWRAEMTLIRGERHGATEVDLSVRLDQEEERQRLTAAILKLPEQMRSVLAMYHLEDMRLAEIGEVMGLSESRVSRVLNQAILQLRAIFGNRMLD
ncbi:sigma-70 family RNA polymerase sigma factor [Planctomicrobium sp. SH668]|uniref:sigma-70 family RNA polymerase sigma factor n=1 Tax=Planctomicrobium sp. SH668 TaxID=3448126 RepID=UPI003F5C8363